MLKFSSIFIISILMFIIPALNGQEQQHVDSLEHPTFTTLLFDHEFEMTQISSFFEWQASKFLVAYRCEETHAIQLILHEQLVLNVNEYFPHDKPFFIVKKFQSNYLI